MMMLMAVAPKISIPALAADLMNNWGALQTEWFIAPEVSTHQVILHVESMGIFNHNVYILAEGAIALSVTLSGGALFAS